MTPKAIVIHLSASRWGSASEIDGWHKHRGWTGIGYHKVILNGCRWSTMAYAEKLDGKIEDGRPENKMGAHCKAGGMNMISLGICCIGTPGFVPEGAEAAGLSVAGYIGAQYLTKRQLDSLVDALWRLCVRHDLNPTGKVKAPDGRWVWVISQHSDHDYGKPLCASLNMQEIRAMVRRKMG